MYCFRVLMLEYLIGPGEKFFGTLFEKTMSKLCKRLLLLVCCIRLLIRCFALLRCDRVYLFQPLIAITCMGEQYSLTQAMGVGVNLVHIQIVHHGLKDHCSR